MTFPSDTGRKRDIIIQAKRENPQWKLKDIAEHYHVDYGYTRNVWGRYVKGEVTKRVGPSAPSSAGVPALPVQVQRWYYWNQGPTSWYDRCPVGVSLNRNGQKRFSSLFFGFMIHKSGKYYVWPYNGEAWEGEFQRWLGGWLPREEVELLSSTLQLAGRKEVAVHAPGVPKGFRIKVKGLGTFKADKTPWPDGSLEYEVDMGAEKRMDRVESALGNFAEQIEAHLKAIRELGQAASELRKEVQDLRHERQGQRRLAT